MTEPGPDAGREHPHPEAPTEYYPVEAPTQQFVPPPQGPRDHRTWWWIGGGIGALVVVGLVIGLVLASGDDTTQAAGPGPAAAGAPATSGAGTNGGEAGKHKRKGGAGGLRVGAGVDALQGPVAAVGDGKLTITPEGLPAVTVTTTDSTKVTGGGASALADLKPGEQVIVLVKSGTATQIRVRGAGAGKGTGDQSGSRPTG